MATPTTTPPKQISPVGPPSPPSVSRGILWLLVAMATVAYLYRMGQMAEGMPVKLSYAQFFRMLQNNNATPTIHTAILSDGKVYGDQMDGTKYEVAVPEDPDLIRTLREQVKEFRIEPPRTFWLNVFFQMAGPLLLLAFFWAMVYRGAQGGGRILAFGKSRARQISDTETRITFDDVAGVDEAKEELREVIEFLKDPKRFQRLGGKIPKGVLLMGPPGTGKTLLAKAVAGEAGVPFFSISGSDFVEMFVGVGASRVRDLFEQAKKSAKTSGRGCIIFIDEIDAVGRQRFAGIGGGHDEREQTLNALLVEMDGFNTQEGVILVAATNRPDVLDPALLRPGRFDRQIIIDRPDINGREAILKVHTRKITLAPGVDLKAIARQTPGFSGADLANLANEGALLAARRDKDSVGILELEQSIERVMAGPERKSRVISNYEKSIVAAHEAGHALVALLVPGADPVHKVSIIPRGTAALGYTMQMPLEDRYIITQKELLGKLTVLFGGRVAEELTCQEVTTGAQNDLEVATAIARRMICEYGMSEVLGHLTFGKRQGMVFLGRDLAEERNYSDRTAVLIDDEVRKILDACYVRARDELIRHRDTLTRLTNALLEHEVLDGEEVKRIAGLARPADQSDGVPPAAA